MGNLLGLCVISVHWHWLVFFIGQFQQLGNVLACFIVKRMNILFKNTCPGSVVLI